MGLKKTAKYTTMKSEFVSGFDSYNLCLTGNIGRTLATPSGGLNEHIPVVLGCDMYNFQTTGNVAVTINATSCDSPSHSGPSLLILNDQGGEVMNTDKYIASTLRAQDHGHPPVVCFEPGIMSRDCSAGNRAYVDICSTLRAQMGDNQPAICYERKQH